MATQRVQAVFDFWNSLFVTPSHREQTWLLDTRLAVEVRLADFQNSFSNYVHFGLDSQTGFGRRFEATVVSLGCSVSNVDSSITVKISRAE